ncbi:hypothetical protein Dimus_026780, partial [Dionaea muscipula]
HRRSPLQFTPPNSPPRRRPAIVDQSFTPPTSSRGRHHSRRDIRPSHTTDLLSQQLEPPTPTELAVTAPAGGPLLVQLQRRARHEGVPSAHHEGRGAGGVLERRRWQVASWQRG